MNQLIKKTPSPKVIAIFFILLVIFSGVILSLGSYYSQNNGQVAGETAVADPVKLEAIYRETIKQALAGYLILDTNIDWWSDDLLAQTTLIKNTLLNLKVTTNLKDQHLQAIIALTEIEQGIKSKNLDLVLPNIYKLREIIDNI